MKSEKEKLLARFRRVPGQVEAVERALENEKGCRQIAEGKSILTTVLLTPAMHFWCERSLAS